MESCRGAETGLAEAGSWAGGAGARVRAGGGTPSVPHGPDGHVRSPRDAITADLADAVGLGLATQASRRACGRPFGTMRAMQRTASNTRLTALVRGRVQGVGFRAFIRNKARDAAIAGYAENLADGRVEVVAEGERDELEHLLVHLRNGPSHARVDDLEVEWGEGSGLRGFYTY